MRRMCRRRLVSACLSVAGMVAIGYVAGAAAMFFQLPSSAFLVKAFVGACARRDLQAAVPRLGKEPPSRAWISPKAKTLRETVSPAKAFDGYTLYARGVNGNDAATQAFLVDMQNRLVHRWAVNFSQVWPDPSHLRNRPPDKLVCFFACHVYPNGDLLAVFHGQTAFLIGCGLAKLDKDSNVLWAYPAAIHHDVDVAADGTIYTLEQRFVYDLPEGLERVPTPCQADYLVVLSPDGKLRREPISILAALNDSAYADLLEPAKQPLQRHSPPPGSDSPRIDYPLMAGDPLHTNSVKVLSRDLAANFPLFKPGLVLLSIRHLNALALLDPESGKLVWAARGPWCAQHDAQFLANGHLLLYDNLGMPSGSRVLEYDPASQALPWSYSGLPGAAFYSSERGACQRLPNGNTLVVNSEGGEIFEVTPEKEIIWSCSPGGYMTTARRYEACQLPFLTGRSAGP